MYDSYLVANKAANCKISSFEDLAAVLYNWSKAQAPAKIYEIYENLLL